MKLADQQHQPYGDEADWYRDEPFDFELYPFHPDSQAYIDYEACRGLVEFTTRDGRQVKFFTREAA